MANRRSKLGMVRLVSGPVTIRLAWFPILLTSIAAAGGAASPPAVSPAGITLPGSTDYPDGGMRLVNPPDNPSPDFFNTAVVHPSGSAAYVGGRGKIWQLNLDTFSHGGWVDTQAGTYHCSVIDPQGRFVYFGIEYRPGRIEKFDTVTFNVVDRIVFPEEEGIRSWVHAIIDPNGEFAYFIPDTRPGKIIKIDLSTFEVIDNLELGEDQGRLTCAAIEPGGANAYFTTRDGADPPNPVLKVDLGTFTLVDSIDFGVGPLHGAVVDPQGQYLYLAGHTILKVDLADFGYTRSSDHKRDPYSGLLMGPEGLYVYFLHGGHGTTIVEKYDTSTLSKVGSVGFSRSGTGRFLEPSGRFGYFGLLKESGLVQKLDLLTLEPLERLESRPEYSTGAGASGVITPDDRFAYFGDRHVVKIDLEKYERVSAIYNIGNQTTFQTAIIDPKAKYAYFTSERRFEIPSSIVKIDLENFEHVNTLPLPNEDDIIRDGAIDPAGRYAYFTVYVDGAPGEDRIIKVDLTDFSIRDSLWMDREGYGDIVIDLPGEFAYVRASHSTVRKIDLAMFTFVDSLSFDERTDGSLWRGFLSPSGESLYFTVRFVQVDSVATKIIKIDLSSFSHVATLILGESEPRGFEPLVDPEGRYAYVGLEGTRNTDLVKINLETFSREGSMKIYPFCCWRLGVIEHGGEFAYFDGEVVEDVGRYARISLSQKGLMKGTRFVMSETGKVRHVNFFSHGAAGNLRLGLYDDAPERNLLWQSDVVPNDKADFFLQAPIETGTPDSLVLAAGAYWLAWQVDTSANVPSYVAGGDEGDGFYVPMSFGPFPELLVPGFGSPTAWTTTDERWSVSINYEAYNQTEWWRLFK